MRLTIVRHGIDLRHHLSSRRVSYGAARCPGSDLSTTTQDPAGRFNFLPKLESIGLNQAHVRLWSELSHLLKVRTIRATMFKKSLRGKFYLYNMKRPEGRLGGRWAGTIGRAGTFARWRKVRMQETSLRTTRVPMLLIGCTAHAWTELFLQIIDRCKDCAMVGPDR